MVAAAVVCAILKVNIILQHSQVYDSITFPLCDTLAAELLHAHSDVATLMNTLCFLTSCRPCGEKR